MRRACAEYYSFLVREREIEKASEVRWRKKGFCIFRFAEILVSSFVRDNPKGWGVSPVREWHFVNRFAPNQCILLRQCLVSSAVK